MNVNRKDALTGGIFILCGGFFAIHAAAHLTLVGGRTAPLYAQMLERMCATLGIRNAVTFADIDCFVAAITGQFDWEDCHEGSADFCCDYLLTNDINLDGSVDFLDIDEFVECLINGGCS